MKGEPLEALISAEVVYIHQESSGSVIVFKKDNVVYELYPECFGRYQGFKLIQKFPSKQEES